jgi:hypothetical protein
MASEGRGRQLCWTLAVSRLHQAKREDASGCSDDENAHPWKILTPGALALRGAFRIVEVGTSANPAIPGLAITAPDRGQEGM